MAARAAIVLSGGGAKGAFQVGALDALVHKYGVKPKIVVGTSTGAIQALAVAQGDVDRLVEIWCAIRGNNDIYRDRIGLAGAILGAKSLYNTAPLRKLLRDLYDPAKITASETELRLGVVCLQSGEFRTIDQSVPGLDYWVYASCAMPVFFDPLETSDRQQWVDGGVRDVTPLGSALELNPSGVLVIRAAPPPGSPTTKTSGGMIPLGLRAIDILQSEVSRNDLQNAQLINDMLKARGEVFTALRTAGHTTVEAMKLLTAFDRQLSRYRFAPICVLEPEEDLYDTLEFNPALLAKAMQAGRDAVDKNWDTIKVVLT